MKTEKPDRSIAGMAVLKDIRGLLSVTREKAPPETSPKAEPAADAEKAALEAKLKEFEALVRKQQAALEKLETEKKELNAKLAALQSTQAKPPPPKPESGKLANEVAGLESQKAELSIALAQVEELLQVKIKELARRIAQVYQEAGDSNAGRDFRRMANQLEAAENFGEFIRALVRE